LFAFAAHANSLIKHLPTENKAPSTKYKEQSTRTKHKTPKSNTHFSTKTSCDTISRGGGKRSAVFVTEGTMIEPTPLIRETEVA